MIDDRKRLNYHQNIITTTADDEQQFGDKVEAAYFRKKADKDDGAKINADDRISNKNHRRDKVGDSGAKTEEQNEVEDYENGSGDNNKKIQVRQCCCHPCHHHCGHGCGHGHDGCGGGGMGGGGMGGGGMGGGDEHIHHQHHAVHHHHHHPHHHHHHHGHTHHHGHEHGHHHENVGHHHHDDGNHHMGPHGHHGHHCGHHGHHCGHHCGCPCHC